MHSCVKHYENNSADATAVLTRFTIILSVGKHPDNILGFLNPSFKDYTK